MRLEISARVTANRGNGEEEMRLDLSSVGTSEDEPREVHLPSLFHTSPNFESQIFMT